jgi:hypothetical protein
MAASAVAFANMTGGTFMRFHILTAVALSSLVAIGGLSTSAQAQERLRPVGTVTYEPEAASLERGVFQIRQEERRIRSMRVLAEEGSADVRSLKVVYTDGEVENVRVRQTLKEGERSALFELEEVRPIKSVEISYIPKGAVTLVLLADGRRAEPPPPRPAEWVELNCKSVGLLSDRDTIAVSTSERYRALRLRSANYDIEVAEMTVRYGNGARDKYEIRQVIPAGGRIGPIELRGEARRISQLDFLYRARTIGPFKTKLCVDALKTVVDADDE